MGLSFDEQKCLAAKLTRVLSLYGFLMDAYIIEFFTDNLWGSLPLTWQAALADLSSPQLATLLLENKSTAEVCYSVVWPLSLLAFKATAHALAFPRRPSSKVGTSTNRRPEEFSKNQWQSSKLNPLFRKHVKPKKQHEIWQLGQVVKKLSNITGCRQVVDIGSGQGHFSRFLAFGHSLSVTAVEGDPALVSQATKFDQELVQALKKEQAKCAQSPSGISLQGPTHVVGWVNPRAPWQAFLQLLQQGNSKVDPPVAGNRVPQADGTWKPNQGFPGGTKEILYQAGFSQRTVKTGVRGQEDCSEKNSKAKDDNSLQLEQEPLGESHRGSLASPTSENQVLLTGLHACGDLSVTLLRHFVRCPHVVGITSVACCYMKLTTKEAPTPPGLGTLPISLPCHVSTEYGYPLSAWVFALPGHQLSYKSREGACHAIEDYALRLQAESATLRTHCFRAMLETVIRAADPAKKRLGVQTINKAHLLTFEEYVQLGLERVKMNPHVTLDPVSAEAMLAQQQKVVAFFTLSLLLAPLVETLILLDRMIYLQEQGFQCELIPLFNPTFSPRNLVLVAAKTDLGVALSSLMAEN